MKKIIKKVATYFNIEKDITFLKNNIDLFILSSSQEKLPNILLKAKVYGLYSICNNCLSGVDKIIEENVNRSI